MIVDLVMTVCLLADPSSCREERMTYEARGTLAQCMMLSTPYVAQWAGDHPKWTVKSWTCIWPEDRRQGI